MAKQPAPGFSDNIDELGRAGDEGALAHYLDPAYYTKTYKDRRHDVDYVTDYEGYDELLDSGEVDAVYIALPNHLHHEYTIRAARHGVHVLCEKPMAVSEQECREMIQACRDNDVRLMIAWARALAAAGRLDLARHLAERLREFRNPDADEFFRACAGDPHPRPFQCDPPRRQPNWREFVS